MSFESAKKYGFMYSVFNVILPIVAIVMVIAVIYSIIAPPIGEISVFVIGAFVGSSMIIAVASIITLILFFVSMYRLSKYYEEPKIFKNVLYSFLLTILLNIIACIIIVFSAVSSASQLSINPTFEDLAAFISPIILSFIVSLVISIVTTVINGVLYWQAFSKLGEKSGVDSFKTAGTLYLIGTLLSFVGVGSILLWISWIFAAKGYKALQPQSTVNTINYATSTSTASTATSATDSDKIYCSYCGTENIANNISNIYCPNCGKPLHTEHTNT